jgi:hypothetical protein
MLTKRSDGSRGRPWLEPDPRMLDAQNIVAFALDGLPLPVADPSEPS